MDKLLDGLYRQRDSLYAKFERIRGVMQSAGAGLSWSQLREKQELYDEIAGRLRAIQDDIDRVERRNEDMAAGIGSTGGVTLGYTNKPWDSPQDTQGYFEGEPYREWYDYNKQAWVLEYKGESSVLKRGKRAAEVIADYKRLYGDKEERDKHERAMGRAIAEKTQEEVMRQMGLNTNPASGEMYIHNGTAGQGVTIDQQEFVLTTGDTIQFNAPTPREETEIEWLDRKVNEVIAWSKD